MRLLVFISHVVGFAADLPKFQKVFKTTYPVVEALFRSYDEKGHFFGTSEAGRIGQYWAGERSVLLNALNVLAVWDKNSAYSELENSLRSAFSDFVTVKSSWNFMAKSRIQFSSLVIAITALQVVRERPNELFIWSGNGKAGERGYALNLIINLLQMSISQRKTISLRERVYDFQWTQKVSTFFNTDKGYQSVPVPGFSTTMIMLRALIELHPFSSSQKSLKTLFNDIARNTEALSDGRKKLYEKKMDAQAAASVVMRFVKYPFTTFVNLWEKSLMKKSPAEDQVKTVDENSLQTNKPDEALTELKKKISKGITAAAARNIVCRFRATPLKTVKENIGQIIEWIANGAKQEAGSPSGLQECKTLPLNSQDIAGEVERKVAEAVVEVDAAKRAQASTVAADFPIKRFGKLAAWLNKMTIKSTGDVKKAENYLAEAIKAGQAALAERDSTKAREIMKKLNSEAESANERASSGIHYVQQIRDYAAAETVVKAYGPGAEKLGDHVFPPGGTGHDEQGIEAVARALGALRHMTNIIRETNQQSASGKEVIAILKEIIALDDQVEEGTVEGYKRILQEWLKKSQEKQKERNGVHSEVNIRESIANIVRIILDRAESQKAKPVIEPLQLGANKQVPTDETHLQRESAKLLTNLEEPVVDSVPPPKEPVVHPVTTVTTDTRDASIGSTGNLEGVATNYLSTSQKIPVARDAHEPASAEAENILAGNSLAQLVLAGNVPATQLTNAADPIIKTSGPDTDTKPTFDSEKVETIAKSPFQLETIKEGEGKEEGGRAKAYFAGKFSQDKLPEALFPASEAQLAAGIADSADKPKAHSVPISAAVEAYVRDVSSKSMVNAETKLLQQRALDALKKDPIIETLTGLNWNLLANVDSAILKQTKQEFDNAEKEVNAFLEGITGTDLINELCSVDDKILELYAGLHGNVQQKKLESDPKGVIESIFYRRKSRLHNLINAVFVSLDKHQNIEIELIHEFLKENGEGPSGLNHLESVIEDWKNNFDERNSEVRTVTHLAGPSPGKGDAKGKKSVVNFLSSIFAGLTNPAPVKLEPAAPVPDKLEALKNDPIIGLKNDPIIGNFIIQLSGSDISLLDSVKSLDKESIVEIKKKFNDAEQEVQDLLVKCVEQELLSKVVAIKNIFKIHREKLRHIPKEVTRFISGLFQLRISRLSDLLRDISKYLNAEKSEPRYTQNLNHAINMINSIPQGQGGSAGFDHLKSLIESAISTVADAN